MCNILPLVPQVVLANNVIVFMPPLNLSLLVTFRQTASWFRLIFCRSLFHDTCLPLLRSITGIELTDTIDMTCSKYEYTGLFAKVCGMGLYRVMEICKGLANFFILFTRFTILNSNLVLNAFQNFRYVVHV